jgi:hypothetical protein
VHREAFVLIELPLVICLFLAVVGIVTGGILCYRNGSVTPGAWVGFSLVLPFCALLVFVLRTHRRQRKHRK